MADGSNDNIEARDFSAIATDEAINSVNGFWPN